MSRIPGMTICYSSSCVHLVHAVSLILAQLKFFSINILPLTLLICQCADGEVALSDYCVEQQYRLTYHNKLSWSPKPRGRSLHLKTKKIKRVLQLKSVCGHTVQQEMSQCDRGNAFNSHVGRVLRLKFRKKFCYYIVCKTNKLLQRKHHRLPDMPTVCLSHLLLHFILPTQALLSRHKFTQTSIKNLGCH